MRDPLPICDPDTDLPLNKLSRADFDKEWLYTPVRLRGIIDNSAES